MPDVLPAPEEAERPDEPADGGARRRRWEPGYVLDIGALIGPLRHGRGDPTCRIDEAGVVWRVGSTPAGPATTRIRRTGTEVVADAWGEGADWVLDGLPALLGADDDDTGFVGHHPVVSDARHRLPGLRLGSCGAVWDQLFAAILEQKVTGTEAHRSWRELCWRFGATPPGPAPRGMRVPPTPRDTKAIPDWEWHKAGVDSARRRAILAAATVAHRLEKAVELRGVEGRSLLRKIPGIGVWTAAEVAQRAWGDPDAVSVGDFHIPSTVGYALVGRKLDDAGMLEVLACYAPQRQRAVRYIEASGFRRPRFGPRYSPRDFRGM